MSSSVATNRSFKTRLRHRRLVSMLGGVPSRPDGNVDAPEVIRLDPLPGVPPSSKPPVRIFVGTEPAQFRAERVFVYSITRVRDPGRTYEIHLMRDLTGFDRSTWKTGFTQYRYAVPFLAGYSGRAIYNDVDQIYLADPAELFDLSMDGNAVLSIDDRETSVMLLDCEKLESLWPISDARSPGKHKQFRARVREAGLWGKMDRGWNTRDDEHALGRTKVLHFTTLHTQPWRPFPRLLRYRAHPFAGVWQELDREADRDRFTLFTEDRPSSRYQGLKPASTARSASDEARARMLSASRDALSERISRGSAARLLYIGADSSFGDDEGIFRLPGAEIEAGDAVPAIDAGPFDGVAVFGCLDSLPVEDVQWVLHRLFQTADRFVFVALSPPLAGSDPGSAPAQPASWWRDQVAAVARCYDGIGWTVCAWETPAERGLVAPGLGRDLPRLRTFRDAGGGTGAATS